MPIKDQLEAINQQIQMHEREIAKLELDIQKVQIDCPHSEWTESLLGYGPAESSFHCAECGVDKRKTRR